MKSNCERDCGLQFWKFKDLLGSLDRVAFAYAANRKNPREARQITRATGSINHNRTVDFFRGGM